MNREKKRFIVLEAVLLAAAAIFAFALVGYRTISLVLLAVAIIAALYRLIAVLLHGKGQKTAKILLTSCVILAVAGLIAVEVPIVLSAKTDADPKAPYLIVLGAGVNGETPSLSLLNRLEAAKEYLDDFPESKAILSGAQGPGEDISEAECMRRWLEENGVSPKRLIMEERARSTYENIAFSLDIIEQDGGERTGKVAIVSSEYHLYRAKYIAAELGAKPLGVAGRTSYPVLMINYFIREAAAVSVMWLT